jgi:hypothetical protein
VTLYQIWPATSGPGSATVDGGVNLAVEFYVTDPGLSVTALRFWRADTSILGPVTARIYTVTDASSGVPLAGTDVTFTLSGTGWQTAAFASPAALTANQRYRAVCNFPTNYSADGHYWDSGAGAGGITHGPLVAPDSAAATGGDQGSFVVGGALAYPTNQFNAANYWVDVNVQSGQTVTIGQAAETDTATPSLGRKTWVLGQAASTETATAFMRRKTVTIGQALTASTAQPVTIPAGAATSGYPDIERVLCDLLADLGNTGTRTPDNLQDRLEFIRIRRVGGNDDQVTDRARVDVEVFAATRAAGETLTEQIRRRLSVRGPLTVTSGGRPVVVDRSQLLAGPVELAWPDPEVRMFHATYQLESRRPWP